MFQSKVSTNKSLGGEASLQNTSSAPGFVPVSCPTHHEYSITNICKTVNCIEPLCPECIPAHVQLHQQTKQPTNIENIISTRLKCIEQLATMKYDAQKQANQLTENSSIDKYLESHQRRLDTAYQKVHIMVQELFTQFSQQFQIISNAFQAQKDKREREVRNSLGPLNEYLTRISQAKQELESHDYIPVLIELLNQPPIKPKVENLPTAVNYGTVEINEKYFDEIKNSILKFVNVKVSDNAGKAILHKSNYYSSNNMKFSSGDRSASREKSQGGLSLSLRSSNKNMKFGAQSIFSELGNSNNEQSVLHTFSKNLESNRGKTHMTLRDSGQLINLNLTKNSYFTHESSLVYFKENSNYFYSVQLECVEAGFRKISLAQEDFRVPTHHKTVILPNGRVLLLGGEHFDESKQSTSNYVFEVINENELRSLQAMNQGRSDFGACYFNQTIFVCGGITNFGSQHNPKKAISSCQMYSLLSGQWKKIAPLPEPSFQMTVCPIGNKILKCGGYLESHEYLHRIDLYCPMNNVWVSVVADRKFLPGIGSGAVQISENSVVIFGGYNPFTHANQAVDYIVELDQDGCLDVRLGNQLYNEACFESAYLYKGAIYAIQQNESNRGKIIMGYRYDQWRFISC